jgi:hypothetical protein
LNFEFCESTTSPNATVPKCRDPSDARQHRTAVNFLYMGCPSNSKNLARRIT